VSLSTITRFTVREWKREVIPVLGYSRFNAGNGLISVISWTIIAHPENRQFGAVLTNPGDIQGERDSSARNIHHLRVMKRVILSGKDLSLPPWVGV